MKSVEKRVKAPSTILEVCERLRMSRPTVMKILKARKVNLVQNGRGGKIWVPENVVAEIENGR